MKLFACNVVYITKLLWIIINVWWLVHVKDAFVKYCTEVIYCFNFCFDHCHDTRSESALLKHLLYILSFSTEQLIANCIKVTHLDRVIS